MCAHTHASAQTRSPSMFQAQTLGFQIRSRTLLPPPAGCAPTPLTIWQSCWTGRQEAVPVPLPLTVTYHSSRPLLGTFSMKLHNGRTHSRT